jgi:hypothetical protein
VSLTAGGVMWETPTVPIRDTARCPGCHREVPVGRSQDVNYEITRGHTRDGREEITITIGRVTMHHCILFPHGEWR